MRYESFDKDHYYKISGSAPISNYLFLDNEDKVRFIFLLIHLQSPIRIYNSAWYTIRFLKKGAFPLAEKRVLQIVKNRGIDLLTFCLLPEKFELILRNREEKMLSVYMHRVLTAYSKYFNAKYSKKGHVFAGPFGAARLSATELAAASAEIHSAPRRLLAGTSTPLEDYLWSSYQDHIKANRWGKLFSPDVVLGKFKNENEYKKFVENWVAKKPS